MQTRCRGSWLNNLVTIVPLDSNAHAHISSRRYLRQLNIDKDILSMKNFNIYDPMKRGQGLILDGQTLSHVEVLQNNEGTDEGSLLKILGRCVTPFGKITRPDSSGLIRS